MKIKKIIPFALLALAAVFFTSCLTISVSNSNSMLKNRQSLTEEQKKQAFDVDFRFDYSDASMKAVVKFYLYDYLTGRKLAEFEVSRYANFEESLNQCLDKVPGTFTESFAK